jgi:hypothetical protein
VVLHIYHCNRVIARDKRRAVGRNRPDTIVRYPERPGGADIEFEPPADGFGSSELGALLEAFRDVPIDDDQSFVTIDYERLASRLSIPRGRVEQLVRRAGARRLLTSLTNRYDNDRWMSASTDKGCLLVMACVEQLDLSRTHDDVVGAFRTAVCEIRNGIIGASQELRTVFVMPNVHLGPRLELATDSSAIVSLISAASNSLKDEGFEVQMNSFGYSKNLEFSINAHPLGYVLRVV